MFFKNGVKNIQASGYNGARTVHVKVGMTNARIEMYLCEYAMFEHLQYKS